MHGSAPRRAARTSGSSPPSTGWNLYVGGNGGQTPKHAQLLASGDLDDETLIRYIDRYLMFYVRTADRLQRTAPWLESLEGGLDHLREVVCEDSLGIAADLEAAMAPHVAGYRDEWAAVLDDREKLSRFVSFVNAPDVAGSDGRVRRIRRPQGPGPARHSRCPVMPTQHAGNTTPVPMREQTGGDLR